jgi:hypothetical protein
MEAGASTCAPDGHNDCRVAVPIPSPDCTAVTLAPQTLAPGSCDNYAFPAKKLAPEGPCLHLRDRFVMTEPQAWQLLERTPVQAESPPLCRSAEQAIDLLKGQRSQLYRSTPFAQLEGRLLQLPVSAL